MPISRVVVVPPSFSGQWPGVSSNKEQKNYFKKNASQASPNQKIREKSHLMKKRLPFVGTFENTPCVVAKCR